MAAHEMSIHSHLHLIWHATRHLGGYL